MAFWDTLHSRGALDLRGFSSALTSYCPPFSLFKYWPLAPGTLHLFAVLRWGFWLCCSDLQSLNCYLHELLTITLTFFPHAFHFNPEILTLSLSIGHLFSVKWSLYVFLFPFLGHRLRVCQESEGQDLDTVWHPRVPGPWDHPQQGTGCCPQRQSSAASDRASLVEAGGLLS